MKNFIDTIQYFLKTIKLHVLSPLLKNIVISIILGVIVCIISLFVPHFKLTPLEYSLSSLLYLAVICIYIISDHGKSREQTKLTVTLEKKTIFIGVNPNEFDQYQACSNEIKETYTLKVASNSGVVIKNVQVKLAHMNSYNPIEEKAINRRLPLIGSPTTDTINLNPHDSENFKLLDYHESFSYTAAYNASGNPLEAGRIKRTMDNFVVFAKDAFDDEGKEYRDASVSLELDVSAENSFPQRIKVSISVTMPDIGYCHVFLENF